MSGRYKKLCVALRYYLIGKGYYKALDAFEFNASYHTGTRKDKVTPEFQHQIEICLYLVTILPCLTYPEETLIAALSHDVCEDYDVPHAEIRRRYGDLVADAVFLLDKNGKTTEGYFEGIATNEIASVVKGADRINNLQTMVGVFTREKQLKYIEEVEQWFLPMLKRARRLFARQVNAYENIKLLMCSQIQLLKVINAEIIANGR